MSPAPERFIRHLKAEGYHPRSDKLSNALCRYMLDDLLERCPVFARHAAAGEIVFALNHKVHAGATQWNVDLVIGPPARLDRQGLPLGQILEDVPATVRIACEIKGVMTEHGKARRNRLRDFDSLHGYVHRSENRAVAAALLVLNVAEKFQSPLRDEVSEHHGIMDTAQETVTMFKGLPVRSSLERDGLEANGMILVHLDNITWEQARLWTQPPAPQPGDPAHYDSFIRTICNRYQERWG
jgi:hypothetical protein